MEKGDKKWHSSSSLSEIGEGDKVLCFAEEADIPLIFSNHSIVWRWTDPCFGCYMSLCGSPPVLLTKLNLEDVRCLSERYSPCEGGLWGYLPLSHLDGEGICDETVSNMTSQRKLPSYFFMHQTWFQTGKFPSCWIVAVPSCQHWTKTQWIYQKTQYTVYISLDPDGIRDSCSSF